MKLSPSVKGFLIALVAMALSFAVYFVFLQKKNNYLVDNPTAKSYFFRINNGPELILAAGQFVDVDLKKGKNSVKVYNDRKEQMYDSVFTVNSSRGLINITGGDYYIHNQYYGYNINKDSLLLTLEKTVIDGKPYLGAPKHFNGLYSEDFYFNVNEEYDGMVKNIQKVESRSKIFRKQDFLNYHKEYYQH